MVPFAVLLLSSMVLADSHSPYFGDCRRDTFGDSFRSIRDNQILNPDAGMDLEPVEGMDGRAAEAGYKKYIESFSKQKGGESSGTVGFLPQISAPGGGGK